MNPDDDASAAAVGASGTVTMSEGVDGAVSASTTPVKPSVVTASTSPPAYVVVSPAQRLAQQEVGCLRLC